MSEDQKLSPEEVLIQFSLNLIRTYNRSIEDLKEKLRTATGSDETLKIIEDLHDMFSYYGEQVKYVMDEGCGRLLGKTKHDPRREIEEFVGEKIKYHNIFVDMNDFQDVLNVFIVSKEFNGVSMADRIQRLVDMFQDFYLSHMIRFEPVSLEEYYIGTEYEEGK